MHTTAAVFSLSSASDPCFYVYLIRWCLYVASCMFRSTRTFAREWTKRDTSMWRPLEYIWLTSGSNNSKQNRIVSCQSDPCHIHKSSTLVGWQSITHTHTQRKREKKRQNWHERTCNFFLCTHESRTRKTWFLTHNIITSFSKLFDKRLSTRAIKC